MRHVPGHTIAIPGLILFCIAVAAGCVFPEVANAADGIRDYNDPGYHRMGVYGGGPKSYFDYNHTKLSLGNSFPNKKNFWAARHAAAKDGKSTESPHTVWIVYSGIRAGEPFEVCRRRIDAWLKPEPGIPTYPDTIPAVCLGEENVGSRSKLMDQLARHIRDSYGIPVFQWYSDPFGPNTSVTADGWIWDSYGWSPERFRRHVMGFVLLGKPAVCVPWASDPHWPQWTQYPTTADLINREWHQFDTCKEFNVSTAPFCVAGPGAMNPWLGSSTPDMIHLRRALLAKRRAMHALPRGSLPLASANYSAAARVIPVGGDPGQPSVYTDDFNGTTIVHDASIEGFLDLKLTSRPAEPGFLVVRPRPKATEKTTQRAVDVSLTYHLRSYFPLKTVRVRLDATAPRKLSAKNTISISHPDGRSVSSPPLVQASQADTDNDDRDAGPLIVMAGTKELQGTRDLLVRIDLTQERGDSTNLTHRLDRLSIECEHEPPPEGSSVVLTRDQYGNLSYDDDFTTTRWQHFGGFKTGHASHAGFRDAGFWVGLKGGYPVSNTIVQRFSSPHPLKELKVSVDGYANSTDLGGQLILKVAPRDGKPLWSTGSKGRHKGRLTLRIPTEELTGASAKLRDGLQHFDVRVTLRSTSGVENGPKACATFDAIHVRAR